MDATGAARARPAGPVPGTETRVFDPASGLVHKLGVVAGDDWTSGTPLPELVDELAGWAEARCDERILRDDFLREFRADPGVGAPVLRPLAVLVRRHGPAEAYEPVLEGR